MRLLNRFQSRLQISTESELIHYLNFGTERSLQWSIPHTMFIYTPSPLWALRVAVSKQCSSHSCPVNSWDPAILAHLMNPHKNLLNHRPVLNFICRECRGQLTHDRNSRT